MKRDERKIALRRAVYTRVSTDSGLEQDFNSLDNQREASEAYINSQADEAWKLVRERYDGGGFSGGSMERPALRRLLGHVRARKTVVVVYKVDRLTRSLADFAKLVELFDAHGVSFNWVAQAFNATTSMGRLTLQRGLCLSRSLSAKSATSVSGTRPPPRNGRASGSGRSGSARLPGARPPPFSLSKVKRSSSAASFAAISKSAALENVHSPTRMSRRGKKTGGASISRGHL